MAMDTNLPTVLADLVQVYITRMLHRDVLEQYASKFTWQESEPPVGLWTDGGGGNWLNDRRCLCYNTCGHVGRFTPTAHIRNFVTGRRIFIDDHPVLVYDARAKTN